MSDAPCSGHTRWRVWIARYDRWQPQHCREIPPQCVAVEPAEPDPMSSDQAEQYVEAFNQAALAAGRHLWAIAVPVTIRYDGDCRPGEVLSRPVQSMTCR
ncbi:MAG: hypothetical protein JXB62_19955 [Pirellulales bacterium]|nr:hypothetical protein [Pirellulales bacterium]